MRRRYPWTCRRCKRTVLSTAPPPTGFIYRAPMCCGTPCDAPDPAAIPPPPPRWQSPVKLVLVGRDKEFAWYRTKDGKYDVIGEDLNTNNAVARAAGAGPVWFWRPAHLTRAWTDDMHPFADKHRCIEALALHIAETMRPPS